MAEDYGLSAMTGVLPVAIMAGVTTKVVKELFPTGTKATRKAVGTMKLKRASRPRKISKLGGRAKGRRGSVKGHPGKFSNVGL